MPSLHLYVTDGTRQSLLVLSEFYATSYSGVIARLVAERHHEIVELTAKQPCAGADPR